MMLTENLNKMQPITAIRSGLAARHTAIIPLPGKRPNHCDMAHTKIATESMLAVAKHTGIQWENL